MRRPWSAMACMVAVASVAGCGGSPGPGDHQSVVVLAAASLTDAFGAIAEAFEADTGVSVELSFAGSSALREQVLAGAPADVYASADTQDMEALAAAAAVEDPVVFATNKMEIAVPPANPAGVSGLGELTKPALFIGFCAIEVPCGSLGRQVMANAGLTPSIDTDEPNVRSLLTKIEVGELDAGLVYVTDVISSSGRVVGIPIPDEVNVVTHYPIAVTTTAPERRQRAETFVAFVASSTGRAILADFGFGPP